MNQKGVMMRKIVETKRQQITVCTYRDLMEKFKKQSVKMNKSMSRRIEEFIIKELEKENEKNEK